MLKRKINRFKIQPAYTKISVYWMYLRQATPGIDECKIQILCR